MDALVGLVAVALTAQFNSLWFVGGWMLGRAVWWVILTQIMYCPPTLSRIGHAVALIVGNIGFATFFLLVDWPAGWWTIATLTVILPAATFWFVPQGPELSFTVKPLRRLTLLLGITGVAGLVTGFLAIFILQIVNRDALWMYVVGTSLVVTLCAAWWWHEYGLPVGRRLVLASALMMLCIVELLLAVLLWPVSYLTSGFLVTWLWYVLWLMMRYHLTEQGVQWKKQLPFLIGNGILLLVYLLIVVRWK